MERIMKRNILLTVLLLTVICVNAAHPVQEIRTQITTAYDDTIKGKNVFVNADLDLWNGLVKSVNEYIKNKTNDTSLMNAFNQLSEINSNAILYIKLIKDFSSEKINGASEGNPASTHLQKLNELAQRAGREVDLLKNTFYFWPSKINAQQALILFGENINNLINQALENAKFALFLRLKSKY